MSNETRQSDDNLEFDKIKFMYDKVYDEINRCRDWPTKVMTFTSALFVLLIGFINIRPESARIIQENEALIILLITVIAILTISILIIQHLRYIGYRNVQISLQRKMAIEDWKADDRNIFPKEWFKRREKSIFTGFQGWFFYALYIFTFWIIKLSIVSSI